MIGSTSTHGRQGPADLSEADDAERAVVLAGVLLAATRESGSRASRRRARRLTRLFEDPASMAFSLALTDQVARITDPERAVRRLQDLVRDTGLPAFLGPLDRAMLRAGVALGGVAPGIVARGVRRQLRRESAGLVLPAEEPALTRYVARRRAAGVRLNLNVLGEAVLGDAEAGRRLADVAAMIDRPDVDHVSVKVSSVEAQVSSLAFDRSVERVIGPLRTLFRRAAAADPPVLVNLDMEEYRDLALTLAAFTRVLDEPELLVVDAGIALQAYLPDAHDALEHLAAWATDRRRRGGGTIKVRLVKGANLAMEQVDAELHGWPQAPYPTKADVDASYKRLVERALDPCWGDALRVGLASHNLFDVAWGLLRAERLQARERLEIEMLEGMSPGAVDAIRPRLGPTADGAAGALLLYAPVVRRDEFDAAIAYLVRRLDENTGPENFLRHQFAMTPHGPAFAEQRDRFRAALAVRDTVARRPRRTQDRSSEDRRFSLAGPFVNEPDTDWSVAVNRSWLQERLIEGAAAPATDVPLTIGRDVFPPSGTDPRAVATGVDPSAPGAPLYRYALAGRADVDRAVAVAIRAQEDWAATTTTARAELLVRTAELMAARRGEAVAVMARDAGKTPAQGDPEVSEAIDMATYYAREAVRLDEMEAEHRPVGPVVVAPPWNFPYAIPAGGVCAALAAGNTVILKPAPETVLTAWLLARCLWDAGVPPEVLQFLPCPDDEVGAALVMHDDVGAVILTGSVDTARLFLSWKPGLRLHAETSGKNAIVVTAAADLDLAVKDIVASAFGHAGQKCSAASLAIVEQRVLDDGAFLRKLADATRTLHVGPACDPAVDVGPLIGPPNDRLARALGGPDPGESWLVAPRRLDDEGYRWSPGVRLGVAPGSFLHRTECFGPVLGVMAARDLEHAVELQNATDFGLTGGLHSLDPAEVARWLASVEVGNAYVNRGITGAIVRRQPFGGWKASAVGPAAKAGGPDYVAGLCVWRDVPGDRGARARSGYGAAWTELAQPQDPTALRAERNEHRYRPLPSVTLRLEQDADPEDVQLCLLAARTVGAAITLSRHGDESVADLRERWRTAPPHRLRVVGTADDELRRAAADAGVALDERRPVADGRIELPRWTREQTVSITTHRHGNSRAGRDLRRAVG